MSAVTEAEETSITPKKKGTKHRKWTNDKLPSEKSAMLNSLDELYQDCEFIIYISFL